MLIDFSKNHFELFGLPASFQLDITQLEQAYRQLQQSAMKQQCRIAEIADAVVKALKPVNT